MKESSAKRIKTAMDELGLRQVDVIEMAQPFCKENGIVLNKSDLSQFLNGKSEPGQRKLTALSHVLKVSEAWLMGYDVPKNRIVNEILDDVITAAPVKKEASIGEKIKQIRKEKGMTLMEAASRIGVTEATVQRWESGNISHLRHERIVALAEAYDIPIEDLFAFDNTEKKPSVMDKLKPSANREYSAVDFVKLPIIGKIAAGFDSQCVEEQTGEYKYVPSMELHGNLSDYFILRVSGDSMYPQIQDGDNILVKRCVSVDPGSIAVMLYEGEEATVKKVNYVYGEDWLDLVPINPEYKTRRIAGSDLEHCRVLGQVIEIMRKLV